MVLTAGQVILVFFIVMAFFSTSIFIFCCEVGHKSVKNYQLQQMGKMSKDEGIFPNFFLNETDLESDQGLAIKAIEELITRKAELEKVVRSKHEEFERILSQVRDAKKQLQDLQTTKY